MPSLCAPPGEKQSGKQKLTFWGLFQKVVRTNEIARLVIITQHFPYNSKIFISTQVSVPFFEWIWCKMFRMLLSYTVAKVFANPRNLTWFTRLFLLVREWGLGTRLGLTRSWMRIGM